MATKPHVDYSALTSLGMLAQQAAIEVAIGDPHALLVPMLNCPVLPGEAQLSGTRTIEAIVALRYFVAHYEEVHGT